MEDGGVAQRRVLTQACYTGESEEFAAPMQQISSILKRKPFFFLLVSLGYLVLVGFIRWGVRPPLDAAIFLLGGLIGVYFLDAAEIFFRLTPSPFRSVLFAALFMLVSFFVVTSSGSFLATGLVLSLYLTMILWQVGEWQTRHSAESWFRLWATPVSGGTQLAAMIAFLVFFLLETFLFVR